MRSEAKLIVENLHSSRPDVDFVLRHAEFLLTFAQALRASHHDQDASSA